jgi:hypothetical protein
VFFLGTLTSKSSAYGGVEKRVFDGGGWRRVRVMIDLIGLDTGEGGRTPSIYRDVQITIVPGHISPDNRNASPHHNKNHTIFNNPLLHNAAPDWHKKPYRL